jgi:hypothetical protein
MEWNGKGKEMNTLCNAFFLKCVVFRFQGTHYILRMRYNCMGLEQNKRLDVSSTISKGAFCVQ